MGPITQHLRSLLPELPQPCDDLVRHWTFDVSLKRLGPEVYSKLLPLHPILNVEYSVLCNQLRHDFLFPNEANKKHVRERLITALMFCELLEHLNQHYLVVPREVVRLRKQQQQFRTLLAELAGFTFASNLLEKDEVNAGLSTSQQIRDLTIQTNWYRICANRSKRVINLLNEVIKNSPSFKEFVANLDSYANPFLAYFGLFFHLPRLMTNSFLIIKHTIPGWWMNEAEASLNWTTRLYGQMQRRWFEMGNDAVWTAVSALSIFVFVGAAATGAVYLSTAAFAFDVLNAAARAYVELRRLYSLHDEYEELLEKAGNREQEKFIRNHLKFIENRIKFEHLRFGLHVSGTVLILGAMSLALPVFAISSPVLLASAVFLVLLWGITFELTRRLDKYRPNETIEVPASVGKLGFFAPKPEHKSEVANELSSDYEIEGETRSPPLFI
ncbi:hypothetical protein [Legionella sp. km772]|uniref:hypothetical protein n=1 Tax=Legionella sp. km772 TaxID=2498111 RepID=UPI000F8EB2C5|nr:hypothetical protein [Legionella sp. km772]RUR12872.1 hypothetical protein ELY15_03800 [Legionella sp. km772]